MPNMKIKYHPEGMEGSRIVPGLMRLTDWGLNAQQLVEWIETCLTMDITTFDHADIYGEYTCEARFGEALKLEPSLRDRIQLVTKCDIMLQSHNRPQINVHHYDTSAQHIHNSVNNSLSNLSTDYIDLLLIHRPDALMDADEVAEALTELRDAGKVKYFGVSNFLPFHFDLLQSRLDFPLITNQVEFSVNHLEPLHDGTFDHAQQHRYTPQAWSPMAGGRVFNSDGERMRRIRSALELVCQQHDNRPIDQVMLAFLMRPPSKVIPVLGTGKLNRIASAVKALEFELTREQWYRIWEASMGHEVP